MGMALNSARTWTRGAALILALTLAACGGGGSGSTQSYNVVVTTSGLAGSGLTLQLNSTGSLPITGNGNATFSEELASGASYTIAVANQPVSPTQNCTVANGLGVVGTGGVNATVTCATVPFPVTATVSGLSGSGLVLTLNGANVPVSNNGVVTLSSELLSGTSYSVAVQSQPTSPPQTCTIGNAAGTVGGAAVNDITVTCATNTYTIAVSVTNLSGTGLVLQLNGASNLTFDSIGTTTATFSSPLPSGANFTATVSSQPSAPTQNCTFNGLGNTASGTVQNTNLTLLMSCTPDYYQWAWEGATILSYGTNGSTPQPGPRTAAVSWADSTGDLWLFSGAGSANDLWKYNIAGGTWTQLTSPAALGTTGIYGTRGTTAPTNVPGSRSGAVAWTDPAGNLWLFGGIGYDSTGATGDLNDLWEYTPGSGLWTWVSGSSTAGNVGVYGTQGAAAAANVPGARDGAVAFADSSGNLWLFGGHGLASTGAADKLNDLWKFSPASGVWTWVSGANVTGTTGVYGTQGVAAVANMPGARQGAVSWIDSAGNLWLFGGTGLPSSGSAGPLNDLWRYSPTSGLWAWVSGSNVTGTQGVYGTEGTPAVTNMPGGRAGAVGEVDFEGNFWLFGGNGLAATASGNLNDLWKYNPNTGIWLWVNGDSTPDQPLFNYGIGQAAIYVTPEADSQGISWIDSTGDLWYLSSTQYPTGLGNQYNYSDLWKLLLPPQ